MLSKKKILLLGADGMLGSMVYSVLKDKYQLILAVRDKSNLKNLENVYGKIDGHTILEFDLALLYQDYLKGFKTSTQSPSFKAFLENVGEIDALINCAGIIIPNSLKDPALTFFINSAVPHLLSSVFN
jgi:short-subunit dehydrogenase